MHVASLLIGSTVGAGGYLYISNLVSERNDRISGALVYKGLPTSQTAFGSLTSAVYAKAKELPKNRERAWSQAQEHVEWCYFFCEGLNLQPNCRRQKEVKDEGCSGKVKGSHHHYDY
ncbi:unnamed protein product [Heterosigma akashiwo]